MEYLAVEDLFSEIFSPVKLQLVAGSKGLKNKITNPRIQKPGLAISGYLQQVHAERVQILGRTEFQYLSTLSEKEAEKKLQALFNLPISCFIVSSGITPPKILVDLADQENIPLLTTELVSSTLISRLSSHLEELLAPELYLHGVLMDVYGIGVLILGSSGIGKSECALELIVRGHRLISDDVVKLNLRSAEEIVGKSPDLSRHYIEIRGLGIINIKDLFGIASVQDKMRVGLVVKLKQWKKQEDCERLGLDEQKINILGVDLPYIVMPVAPGRNLAVIIEVAARNQLLKQKGYCSVKKLDEELHRQLAEKKSEPQA